MTLQGRQASRTAPPSEGGEGQEWEESPGHKVRLKRWILAPGLKVNSPHLVYSLFLKATDLGTEDSITGTA